MLICTCVINLRSHEWEHKKLNSEQWLHLGGGIESKDGEIMEGYPGTLNSTGTVLFHNLGSGYTSFYHIFMDTILCLK